jgi:exoribonuclease II
MLRHRKYYFILQVPRVLVLGVVLQDILKIRIKRILNSTHTTWRILDMEEIRNLFHSKTVSNKVSEHTITKSSLRRSKRTYHSLYLEFRIKRYEFYKLCQR